MQKWLRKRKIAQKIATSTSMSGEKAGEPSRKDRIRSDPFVKGVDLGESDQWCQASGFKSLDNSHWIEN
jgi:hypothetical protein